LLNTGSITLDCDSKLCLKLVFGLHYQLQKFFVEQAIYVTNRNKRARKNVTDLKRT